MANFQKNMIAGDYNLNGYYLIGRQKGDQKGLVKVFQDRKIIGNVRDQNAGRDWGPEKFVLGLCLDDTQIAFLKITPGLRREKYLMPVIWYMRLLTPDKDSHSFEGFWQFVPGAPLSEEIERRLHSKDPLEDLKEMKPEILEQVYFNANVLAAINLRGRATGCKGEIIFLRK